MSTIGSLNGLRVIEIGTSVAAPFAGQILGDLGAEVIKVERLGTGDDARGWNPPAWDGMSVLFLSLNRNKRSIALDYKTPEGVGVLRRLIASCDVLIQNLRPGSVASAGFGYEDAKAINPRIVYCDMTGYGPTGPRAAQPAYDPLLQAYAGIVSITGEDGRPPSRVPVAILDMTTGMWTAIGVLDALRRRDSIGVGSLVQTSLLQTALTWMSDALLIYLSGNGVLPRFGSGRSGVVPYGAFPVSDGHVFISAGNDPTWRKLLAAIDATELDSVEGFSTNSERVKRRAAVDDAVGRATARFTAAELRARLLAAGVPHAPVNTIPDVAVDDQVAAVGQVVPVEDPRFTDLRLVHTPIQVDGSYHPIRNAAPELGADTREILADLGYSTSEIVALLEGGIAAGPRSDASAGRHPDAQSEVGEG